VELRKVEEREVKISELEYSKEMWRIVVYSKEIWSKMGKSRGK